MKNDNKSSKEQQLNIPIGGTLGILAYGYKGINMWRQVRQKHAQELIAKTQKKNEEN